METNSALYIRLKTLTNNLNQATLKVVQESQNPDELVDYNDLKLQCGEIIETIAVLNYLQKNKSIQETISETTESIIDDSETFSNNVIVEIEEEKEEEESTFEIPAKELTFNKPLQDEEALADKFMNKEITDLNNAIGISEKFMFIHELFKGDTEKYISTLSKLNNCSTLTAAQKIVENLSEKLSWDKDTSAYQELNNIITRKYPV